MTFQIQIYWRVMAPFFFGRFWPRGEAKLQKSCDLATSTFDLPKKNRSIFESNKKLDTKKINLWS